MNTAMQIRHDDTLKDIALVVHENAKAKGFHPKRQSERAFINEQVCNLHGEVSELHDAWRNGKFHKPCDKADKMLALGLPALTCAEEEYADIIIRTLDQCERLGIDIEKAVRAKHSYNTTRPFKHGKKS